MVDRAAQCVACIADERARDHAQRAPIENAAAAATAIGIGLIAVESAALDRGAAPEVVDRAAAAATIACKVGLCNPRIAPLKERAAIGAYVAHKIRARYGHDPVVGNGAAAGHKI